MDDFKQPTEREIEIVRAGISLHKRKTQRRDMAQQLVGVQRALEALHGPPPTQDELAQAHSLVAAQKARDFGMGGLFG